jgi:hypothetical protein
MFVSSSGQPSCFDDRHSLIRMEDLDAKICSHSCARHCEEYPANIFMSPFQDIAAIDRQIQHGFETVIIPLKRARNQLTSACRLPAEVLLPIIHLAIPNNETSDLLKRNAIAHVCHAWRNIAIGDWTLWSRIDLGVPQMSQQLFARCVGAEVEVFLKESPLYNPLIGDATQAISHAFTGDRARRIVKLSLDMSFPFTKSQFMPIFDKLQPELSNLQSLHLSVLPHQPADDDLLNFGSLFRTLMKKLHIVSLTNCRIEWSAPDLRHLNTLILGEKCWSSIATQEWQNIVDGSMLEHIDVDMGILRWTNPYSRRIILPSLKTLIVRGHHGSVGDFLLAHALPRGVDVSIVPMSATPGIVASLRPFIVEFFQRDDTRPSSPVSVTYSVHSYLQRTVEISGQQGLITVRMPSVLRNDDFELGELFSQIPPLLLDRIASLQVLHTDTQNFYTDSAAWTSCFQALVSVVDVTVDKSSIRGLCSLWSRTPGQLPKVTTLRVRGLEDSTKIGLLVDALLTALKSRAGSDQALRDLYLDSHSSCLSLSGTS